jgi:hypothetical protein
MVGARVARCRSGDLDEERLTGTKDERMDPGDLGEQSDRLMADEPDCCMETIDEALLQDARAGGSDRRRHTPSDAVAPRQTTSPLLTWFVSKDTLGSCVPPVGRFVIRDSCAWRLTVASAAVVSTTRKSSLRTMIPVEAAPFSIEKMLCGVPAVPRVRNVLHEYRLAPSAVANTTLVCPELLTLWLRQPSPSEPWFCVVSVPETAAGPVMETAGQ